MIPNLAGSDDNFKSWPSGNMTIASMMFSLSMIADVCFGTLITYLIYAIVSVAFQSATETE